MKRNRRQRAVLLPFLLLAGLVAVCGLWLRAQQRQEELNQELIRAVRRSDTAATLSLLRRGASANAREFPPNHRPLWLTFLAHRFGSRTGDEPGNPVLLVAFYWRKDAGGATVFRPFHNFALVQALVEQGANVNVADPRDGRTPLLSAACEGQRDVVRYLIDHGADVNARDEHGNTPLSWVATWQHRQRGDDEIVNALLDRGADINGAYSYGTTPLMFALQSGNLPTARLLLKRHPDINRKDKRGLTAVSLAQNRSDKEMLGLLKMAGARVDGEAR